MALKVKGVHYSGLAASKNMERAFAQTMEDSVAASAGDGISQNNICVQLTSGSVAVEAVIMIPEGVSASTVESRLASTETVQKLSESIAVGVTKIPGIEAVKTSAIGVSHVTSPKPKPTRSSANAILRACVGCLLVAVAIFCIVRAKKKDFSKEGYSPMRQSSLAIENGSPSSARSGETRFNDVEMNSVIRSMIAQRDDKIVNHGGIVEVRSSAGSSPPARGAVTTPGSAARTLSRQ